MRSRIIGGALALATLFATSMLVAPAASATPAPPAPLACAGCWHPALNTSWQWKLSALPTAAEISAMDVSPLRVGLRSGSVPWWAAGGSRSAPPLRTALLVGVAAGPIRAGAA